MTKESPRRSSPTTRVVALIALGAVVMAVACGAKTAYFAATDSFVAPMRLSADSDIVLNSKLRLSTLKAEKAKLSAERERVSGEHDASDAAVRRLEELQHSSRDAIRWTSTVTQAEGTAARGDRDKLREQQRALRKILDTERELFEAAKADLDAGLISKLDLARAKRDLQRAELAFVENRRAQIATGLQVKHARLAEAALDEPQTQSGAVPPMPEVLARQSQDVHIELELMRQVAQRRAAAAKLAVLDEQMGKLDELIGQLSARPTYRAIDSSVDVAFVPYTQMEGVVAGAVVHDCVWGIFACEPVGRIRAVIPGEVVLPDPWGSQARGQYAELELLHGEAIRSKVLRVRPGQLVVAAEPDAAAPAEQKVSASTR